MTWELVDVHAGIDEDQREFMPHYALWCTVQSEFVDIRGEQGWDSASDLGRHAHDANSEDRRRISRALALFPDGQKHL